MLRTSLRTLRWLQPLPLVALACTPNPVKNDAAPSDPARPVAAAPAVPSILPPRSLSVEEKRDDLKAPLSLTATDGTGLRLVSLRARAVVEGPLAFTELELEFENPQPRRIEGRFEIDLPSRAAISRFAMKIGNHWQEGEVVERQAARRAYEDFLHRRQDPALLEHDAGNSFGARVFPIEANARKQLVVSYSQELVHDGEAYRLPLRGLPEIDSLDISATIAGVDAPARTWVERDVTPDRDFEIELAPTRGAIGVRHDEHALARVTVGGVEEPVAMGDLVVLFDTSASQAIGFDRRIRRLGGLMRALQADVGAPIPLQIIAFDQTIEEIFSGTTETLDDAALARLASRRALGASDLTAALQSLTEGKPDRRVLLVTDGVATTGAKEQVALERAASELASKGISRIDVLADGSQADAVLAAVATAPSMAPGVVIDADLDDRAMVHKLRTLAFEAIDVAVPGAEWVWPARVEGVQPGDEVLVYASLPPSAAMRVGLGDGEPQAVATTDVPGPLLRRAWMRAHVQRLTERYSSTLELDTHARDALKKMIIDLSVKERVLSEFTALLVLETEADYARFGIDRNALAEVLAIGDSGVTLNRRDPMPSVPEPARLAEAPEWLAEGWGPGIPGGVPGGFTGGIGRGGGADGAKGAPADVDDDESGGSGRRHRGEEGSMGRPSATQQEVAADPGEPVPEPEAAARDDADLAPPPAAIEPARPPATRLESESPIEELDGKPEPKKKIATKRPPHGWHGPMSPPPMPSLGEVTIGTPAIDGSLAVADVTRVLATRKQQLAWCAANATPGKPVEHGALELRLVVDAAGLVTLARLRERDVLDPSLVHCIESVGGRWMFSAGKPTDTPIVVVPLGFGKTKPVAGTLDDRAGLDELRRTATDLAEQRKRAAEEARKRQEEREAAARAEQQEIQRTVGSPYTGKMFDVMQHLSAGRDREALELAAAWQLDQPGDVVALLALGEVAEKGGDNITAARAYGSIIDLFPSRADLRRYASARLLRTGGHALPVAIDSAAEAVVSRPDHPSSHRALAWALVAAGQHRKAAHALVAGLRAENVPWGRFNEVQRILREDLGLVGAAWAATEPAARAEINALLAGEGATLSTSPSLRFVLTWETDANDVDFHIHDGKGGHAFYSDKVLPSGGSLYADITTGYGPECFAIEGTPTAFPYNLRAHYYSRGPMGYGTGRVHAIQHDGKGTLVVREYPFVVMKDQEWIDLGTIKGPL